MEPYLTIAAIVLSAGAVLSLVLSFRRSITPWQRLVKAAPAMRHWKDADGDG